MRSTITSIVIVLCFILLLSFNINDRKQPAPIDSVQPSLSYIIVEATNTKQLQALVNIKLHDGYIPIGGFVVDRPQNPYGTRYFQTMSKK